MEKLKACLTKALARDEPSDEEVAEAVMEALDVIDGMAKSLDRIAAAAEAMTKPVIEHHDPDDRGVGARMIMRD